MVWQTIKKRLPFVGRNEFNEALKATKIAQDAVLRPLSLENQGKVLYPKFGFGGANLRDFALNSDVLSAIQIAIRREMFRNGFTLEEADTTKKQDITDSEQEESNEILSKEQILMRMERVNEDGQRLKQVLEEIEDDWNIHDEAFVFFSYDYELDGKDLKVAQFNEMVRLDPTAISRVVNKYDQYGKDDDGNNLYFSLSDRSTLIKEEVDQDGVPCLQAFYCAKNGDNEIYYGEKEIVNQQKYRPSRRGGHSPILTVWQKVRTLMYMDAYVMKLYDGQRPPKAGLFFKTSNIDTLNKAWDQAETRARENPHMPVVMGVPTQDGGGNFVNFIDFMKGLDELQHSTMRDEYGRKIGAVFGVMPLFQSDVSTSGGLNNEGLQITVTNRAIEYGQSLYNDYILPKFLKAIGAKGWILRLNPSEERDEMAELQREALMLSNAERAANLGLEVEYDEKDNKIHIKSGQVEKPVTSFGGGFPFQADSADSPSGAPEAAAKSQSLKPVTKGGKELALKLKEIIEKFFKKLGKKPEVDELDDLLVDVNGQMGRELKASVEREIEREYKKSMDQVERESNQNLLFTQNDKNMVEALVNQDVLAQAFSGVTNKVAEKIRGVISESLSGDGLSISQISKQIEEVSDLAAHRAENIARTETSKVQSAARLNSYKQMGDFDSAKFEHIGIDDNRTTATSKRIKERTRGGVSWNDYVKIMKEESAKDFPEWRVDENYPVSHYQSRHIFRKII